jgi:hypothetical protein
MTEITLEQEIMDAVQHMNLEQQRMVLDYAHSITRPRGTPGKLAVQYAEEIGFSSEDLREMEQAIEEWCERVDDFPEVDLDG